LNWFRRLAFSLAFILLLSSVLATAAKASTIDQAEQGLEEAFVSVRSAEQAGVNVTLLAAKLEEAGSMVVDARYELYVRNDSLSAGLLINQSLTLAGEIRAEAVSLENTAISEGTERLFWTAAASNSGLCALLVFGLLGYRFLSRWFIRRLLRMTPKVADKT
jgi:hypothetical protein